MGTVIRKSTAVVDRAGFDPDGWDVPLVLTAAVQDREGDVVHPGGCVPAARMYANYEHDPDHEVGELLKGVTLVSVPGLAGGRVNALKGVSRLDRDSPYGVQCRDLIAAGVLGGASIEFEPLARPVGRGFKSLLAGREAYEFPRWRLLGVAHCAVPVNRLSGVVMPDPADPAEVAEKALRFVTDRRVNGRALLPVFAKSLSAAARPRPAAVTVPGTVVEKAMTDLDTAPPADDALAQEPPPPADDAPAPAVPPEASLPYDVAQALTDFADQLDAAGGSSLHDDSRDNFAEFAAELRAVAAKHAAHGDAVMTKVGAAPGADDVAVDDIDVGDDSPEMKAVVAKALRRGPAGVLLCKGGYVPKVRVLKASDIGQPVGDEFTAEQKARLKDLEKRVRRVAR